MGATDSHWTVAFSAQYTRVEAKLLQKNGVEVLIVTSFELCDLHK